MREKKYHKVEFSVTMYETHFFLNGTIALSLNVGTLCDAVALLVSMAERQRVLPQRHLLPFFLHFGDFVHFLSPFKGATLQQPHPMHHVCVVTDGHSGRPSPGI